MENTMSQQIVFFTSNPAKIKEAEQAFNPIGIKVVPHKFDFLEIQSESQEQILRDKFDQIKDIESCPFLVDDSGFYLEAYPGFPGVMSKFIYQTIECLGILRLLTSGLTRRAYFRAVIGLGYKGQIQVFEGRCEGVVTEEIHGETQNGFLFEPIFKPDGANKTMAQMSLDERKVYSYRSLALKDAATYMKSQWI